MTFYQGILALRVTKKIELLPVRLIAILKSLCRNLSFNRMEE